MIRLDGSMGEGGGQILRSALGLSAVTGRAFEIHHIRARRRRPGLGRQHLAAVQAAAEVCGARVEGAEPGSMQLRFEPGPPRPGRYRFDIGSAGSTTLVLQTLLPPLFHAAGPSEVVLRGGTHNPQAPPFDFVDRVFAPVLARMGAMVEVELLAYGFYPAGGGAIRARIQPVRAWRPLELLDRGALRDVRATALLSRLPAHIARRELREVQARLGWPGERCRTLEVDSPGPGNVLLLEAAFEHVRAMEAGFGIRGVPAERVAAEAAGAMERFLRAGVPVGAHLADQVLLPMALAGPGAIRTVAPTPHTRTHAAVVEAFLPVRVRFEEEGPDRWLIEVRPAAGGSPRAPEDTAGAD